VSRESTSSTSNVMVRTRRKTLVTIRNKGKMFSASFARNPPVDLGAYLQVLQLIPLAPETRGTPISHIFKIRDLKCPQDPAQGPGIGVVLVPGCLNPQYIEEKRTPPVKYQ
jgi:hypothetical protein